MTTYEKDIIIDSLRKEIDEIRNVNNSLMFFYTISIVVNLVLLLVVIGG